MITQHVTFNTCDHVRVTINSHDDDTRAQWILRVREFLLERLRLDRTTTYTEVNTVVANRLGVALLDFSNPADRDEMSRILREVVILDQRETGTQRLLTAIVIYLDSNEPGPGFFALGVELGLLASNATRDERLEFWATSARDL